MAAKLRVNRTTVVRGLANMEREVISLGSARRTRYALRRSVRNAGNRWPIHVVDEAGRARPWAELEALHERCWRIRWAGEPPAWAPHFSDPEGLWNRFPFFLAGAPPLGFLGRAIAQQISPSLRLPKDPPTWSDDHVLIYLQAYDELRGNTDLHAGNLSFWLDDTLPIRVAPAYDMLPMLWAPGIEGEIVPRTFAPAPPLPSAIDAWRDAAAWAAAFWGRVAAEDQFSTEFQSLVQTASSTFARLRVQVGESFL